MEDIDLKNFVIDGIELDVYDTISKLRFLTKIEESEKVNILSHSVVSDTFFNNIIRSLNSFFVFNDSREVTLNFIKHTTDDAIKITERCFEERGTLHRRIGIIVLDSLKEIKSGSGIKSLMKTYKSDNMFIAKLETFLEILKAKITDIESRIEPPLWYTNLWNFSS